MITITIEEDRIMFVALSWMERLLIDHAEFIIWNRISPIVLSSKLQEMRNYQKQTILSK